MTATADDGDGSQLTLPLLKLRKRARDITELDWSDWPLLSSR
jgi:hypothetical protein